MDWFPSSALPEKTLDYVRYVLDRIDQGATYLNFGFLSNGRAFYPTSVDPNNKKKNYSE